MILNNARAFHSTLQVQKLTFRRQISIYGLEKELKIIQYDFCSGDLARGRKFSDKQKRRKKLLMSRNYIGLIVAS